jgi:hypothetical protein
LKTYPKLQVCQKNLFCCYTQNLFWHLHKLTDYWNCPSHTNSKVSMCLSPVQFCASVQENSFLSGNHNVAHMLESVTRSEELLHIPCMSMHQQASQPRVGDCDNVTHLDLVRKLQTGADDVGEVEEEGELSKLPNRGGKASRLHMLRCRRWIIRRI